MSITFERDGSVTLRDNSDPSRNAMIAPGASAADQVGQIAAFFAGVIAPVPDAVTNYQARAALIAAGLFDKADAAVRASGDPKAVQAWDYANNFYRSSPFIAKLGGDLGLADSQIDDLFRAAAAIDP